MEELSGWVCGCVEWLGGEKDQVETTSSTFSQSRRAFLRNACSYVYCEAVLRPFLGLKRI